MKSIYLPYQYNSSEITKLQGFDSGSYKYDVGIVDCRSKHRKDVFGSLQKHGIQVLNIKGWKDQRDKLIGQCRILLNFHYNNKFQIYEHIRCDRWIMAGKTIISETSSHIKELDITEHVIWSENLVQSVKNVLSGGCEDSKLDIEHIARTRKKHLDNFIIMCEKLIE